MATSAVNLDNAIGFLTVVEDRKHGLFGGYLVLNRSGRPLEFHCTAPVRANRAQEILYGPTLRPYLFGEQIGRTLLEKGKCKPSVVLTDSEPMLAVSEFASVPVAFVGGESVEGEVAGQGELSKAGARTWRTDRAHGAKPHLRFFEVASHRLAVGTDMDPSVDSTVVESLGAAAASLDLAEPFERIRAAIDEARRGGQ